VGDRVIFTYLDKTFTDVTFKAKEDVTFEKGSQTITVAADYIDRSGDAKVEKQSHNGIVNFNTIGTPTIDLVYLSNILDAFGIDNSHADWEITYMWMDWIPDGKIDIIDIAYAARQLQ
jgi:hypothetical protein